MTIKMYLTIAAVSAALLVGLSCKYIFKQSNTPVEKAAEQVVEAETGIKVDFNASDSTLIDNKNELLKKLSEKVTRGGC